MAPMTAERGLTEKMASEKTGADRASGGEKSKLAAIDPRASQPPGSSHLFLREEQIRQAQDLLFFAYRDFTGAADAILAEYDLGRAHHRSLHFIGRNPGMTVSDLLTILGITKQSLARVLNVLIERKLVIQTTGTSDRRQRLLALTPQGLALERRLFERQRELLATAFREAGGPSVEGFRRVLTGIMEPAARAYVGDAAPSPDPKTRTA